MHVFKQLNSDLPLPSLFGHLSCRLNSVRDPYIIHLNIALLNGGVPLFLVEKAMFQMGKMYLFRSPVHLLRKQAQNLASSTRTAWPSCLTVRVVESWECVHLQIEWNLQNRDVPLTSPQSKQPQVVYPQRKGTARRNKALYPLQEPELQPTPKSHGHHLVNLCSASFFSSGCKHLDVPPTLQDFLEKDVALVPHSTKQRG